MEEDKPEYKGQYIHMDLALHRISNGWEESPRMRRVMDTHEEFEFTMSHMGLKDDFYEPAMEVAPADELFFRGQLLPLQHDPRLQLVHTLSCIKGDEYADEQINFVTCQEQSSDLKYTLEDEIHVNHILGDVFPTTTCPNNEDGFAVHSSAHLKPKCVDEEEFSSGFCVQEGVNPIRSSRSDAGVSDSIKNDSRSSSFRSQQSSYWGSGEKDSRDSSSSSRCSNGSSQDAYVHGLSERRVAHHNMAMANALVTNTGFATVVNANVKANHQEPQHGKPPLPASKVKKWSWKALFTGLRKASKIWVDDRGDEQGQSMSQREMNKQKRAVLFSFASTSSKNNNDEYSEGQMASSSSSGEVRRGSQQASGSSRSKAGALGNDEYGGHLSSKYYMGSGGWRGVNYYEGSSNNGGRPGKEKARMGIIAWNARESWQKWVKRPLYGKLSTNTHITKHNSNINILQEDLSNYSMKAKSLSSTPLAKSPVRRADNVSHNPDSSSSSKYMNVGFASCPASMRSSPHHSGVLAVINKSPPASSLHDLHTAIQGAIAHCKQSQTSKPS